MRIGFYNSYFSILFVLWEVTFIPYWYNGWIGGEWCFDGDLKGRKNGTGIDRDGWGALFISHLAEVGGGPSEAY